MYQSSDQERLRNNDLQQLAAVLERLTFACNAPVEMVEIQRAVRTAHPRVPSNSKGSSDEIRLMQAAQQVGIRLAPARLSLADATHLVQASFPLVIEEATSMGSSWWVVEQKGRRAEAFKMDSKPELATVARTDLDSFWRKANIQSTYVAQPVLNNHLSTAPTNLGHGKSPDHSSDHKHGTHTHPKPFARFRGLLRLELRDIATLALFGLVAGVMGLAAPLAVESLVNTVAWGTYLQPLLVLSLIVFCFLGFAGFLRALQSVVAEVLQQRIFVRIVGDLGYRF
ncbi:MAG: hypothetical protein B7Z55_13445, partial [Planctomycetales bacterium 12-60-4]